MEHILLLAARTFIFPMKSSSAKHQCHPGLRPPGAPPLLQDLKEWSSKWCFGFRGYTGRGGFCAAACAAKAA
eukprot:15475218-Alexandrium_andersonii.AAC.1